jgi:hypothetical protein
LTATAAGRTELRAAVERLRRHARRQRGEREKISAGDRQIFNLLLADRLTDRGVRHLQQRRDALHRHVLRDVRELHRHRRLGDFAVAKNEVLELDRVESGKLDADDVGG